MVRLQIIEELTTNTIHLLDFLMRETQAKTNCSDYLNKFKPLFNKTASQTILNLAEF